MVRVVRLERTVSWSQTRRDTNFAIPGYSLFCHDTTARGKNKVFSVCGHLCGQSRFYAVFRNRGKSRKHRRHKTLRRFALPRPGYRHGTPKAGALPTALYPDIRFFCMIPCGEGKSKFFVSVGSAVVKPGFAGGSSGGGFPPQATVPRTSRLSLFGEWIGSLSSQITRAANYATFGHRYFSRPGAFFPTYVRQYTLRSAALALWHHLLLDRGQHDGFILYLSILPVSPPKSSLFASGRYVGKAVRRLWGLRTA